MILTKKNLAVSFVNVIRWSLIKIVSNNQPWHRCDRWENNKTECLTNSCWMDVLLCLFLCFCFLFVLSNYCAERKLNRMAAQEVLWWWIFVIPKIPSWMEPTHPEMKPTHPEWIEMNGNRTLQCIMLMSQSFSCIVCTVSVWTRKLKINGKVKPPKRQNDTINGPNKATENV